MIVFRQVLEIIFFNIHNDYDTRFSPNILVQLIFDELHKLVPDEFYKLLPVLIDVVCAEDFFVNK